VCKKADELGAEPLVVSLPSRQLLRLGHAVLYLLFACTWHWVWQKLGVEPLVVSGVACILWCLHPVVLAVAACCEVLCCHPCAAHARSMCLKLCSFLICALQLAAHDRSVLEKMFLGSVSDYCVTHSKRPVLLLHPHHSALE